MTSAERTQRDADIVAALLRGISARVLAQSFGITPRHVRRIFKEYRKTRPKLEELDRREIVQDILDQHDALDEQLAMIAHSDAQSSVRVGALKAQFALRRQKTDLLTRAGILDDSPGMTLQ